MKKKKKMIIECSIVCVVGTLLYSEEILYCCGVRSTARDYLIIKFFRKRFVTLLFKGQQLSIL